MSDSPLSELLDVDSRRALEFFVMGLRDVAEGPLDAQELFYNASVLAHYTQVSTSSERDVPAPADLTDVFDNFVADSALLHDAALMETAAAQCLLLAGFFEAQMRRRHSIRWYAHLGTGFFLRAASEERSRAKARLLDTLAHRFEPWRRLHARLAVELRAQRYVLRPPHSG